MTGDDAYVGAREAESLGEQGDHRGVRAPALRRGTHAKLPRVAEPADELLRSLRRATTRTRRRVEIRAAHRRARPKIVPRREATRRAHPRSMSVAASIDGRFTASGSSAEDSPSVTTASAARRIARPDATPRAAAPSRRSRRVGARAASALASATVTSASRRACSFMSCAARSAETSVERRRRLELDVAGDLGLEHVARAR